MGEEIVGLLDGIPVGIVEGSVSAMEDVGVRSWTPVGAAGGSNPTLEDVGACAG